MERHLPALNKSFLDGLRLVQDAGWTLAECSPSAALTIASIIGGPRYRIWLDIVELPAIEPD